MEQRLQKIIANSGLVSRRNAEQIIKQGRVKINGITAVRLGTKADPLQDRIEVDGKVINPPEHKVYIIIHKPKGYVTTLNDPQGRPLVTDLIKSTKARVFPVGRLDFNTEGLLLLTNDGELAHLLQHPRHGIARKYLVKIRGLPTARTLERLQKGIRLDNVRTAQTSIKVLKNPAKNTWLEVTLWEGKNRQIRKMFAAVGHPVARILRTGFGPLRLDRVPPGSYRLLTKAEIKKLKNLRTSAN